MRANMSGFALVLILGLFFTKIHSLRFDLESGKSKCIAEDIKSNSMTVGKYHVVNPNEGYPLPDSHKITARVTSTYGNSYHNADNVPDGQFAFQTAEAGDYMACFFAADHKPPITITVDFDWKTGIAAKDWTNVAKKGSVEVMEMELKKMYETVQSIHDVHFYGFFLWFYSFSFVFFLVPRSTFFGFGFVQLMENRKQLLWFEYLINLRYIRMETLLFYRKIYWFYHNVKIQIAYNYRRR